MCEAEHAIEQRLAGLDEPLLIHAQAEEIPVRASGNRHGHGDGVADGSRIGDDVGPINKVGGSLGDVGEIVVIAQEANRLLKNVVIWGAISLFGLVFAFLVRLAPRFSRFCAPRGAAWAQCARLGAYAPAAAGGALLLLIASRAMRSRL